MARMMKHSVALKWGIGESGRAPNKMEASSVLECTALLVDLISRAGEALDAYIQTHSEVPHVEVLECVSTILKDHGFFCNGEGVDVTNLCPFDCKMFAKPYQYGALDSNNIAAGMSYLHATSKKAVRNKLARGAIWNTQGTVSSHIGDQYYYPLLFQLMQQLILKCRLNLNKQHHNYHNSVDQGSSTIRIHSLALVGRTQQMTSYHTCSRLLGTPGKTPQVTSSLRSRRLFRTAVVTLLKVLKISA